MQNTDRCKEALEVLEEILNAVNEAASDSILVVEGRRDVFSLRNLGISGDIRPCAYEPLAAFCENIAETGKGVIILTDWDRRGGILASSLSEQFKNLDVKCDLMFREKILFYSKREIKDVESLYSYVGKLRQMFYPEIDDETV
ncbi:hypothetical protein [Methanolapillus millepedarum]|uniref:Toprim domain-containing protein n=1 Tax=Methanolapillus millepedarum TaxID=3028296 RepID=A0AA97A4F2_9EURY|nr:hypothetical protein MsAc7_13390 [Methanosarcinaceae archaeon Ac7]